MLVEIGHDGNGQGPAVTYAHIPDDVYPLGDTLPGVDQIALHMMRRPLVQNLPGLEPFLAISHGWGVMNQHGIDSPRWIRCSDPRLNDLFAAFHDVPGVAPADLEDTHWTKHGTQTFPPGAIPDPASEITALLTNDGRDIWAAAMWSALGTATVIGDVGTATATSATSLTGGGGATHATNDAVGQTITALSSGAYGYVTANTSGATPVFTVDRWYAPATPGGSAAATPSGTTGYTLEAGGPPNLFIAITANAVAPAMTDHVLAGEIVTAGGGLIRKIGVTAHTAGTNVATVTGVFTANGSDSLPVTAAKLAIGPSMVATVKNALQTPLSATATLNVSGDQLTVTDTITGS